MNNDRPIFLIPEPAVPQGKAWKGRVWLVVPLCIVHFALFIATGCARIVPPDGGAKDTLAPLLVRAVPAPGTTGYKGRKITLEFSEAIQVGPINTQLIIAPVADNPYTYNIRRGRILELEFEKPFPDSVTMSLNFRDAIKDLTEGNIVKNLVMAFATGPVLDTNAVAGQVKDLITGKPVPDALVGLWPIPAGGPDTSSILRQRPLYLTRTTDQGAYVLRNIRKGRYFLAAMLDRNGNLRWSGKQEPVGFPTANLDLAKDSIVNLSLAMIDEVKPRVFSLRPSQDSLALLTVNEGLVRVQVSPAQGADSLPVLYDVRQNRATFRLPGGLADSTAFRISLTDSALNRTDTVVGMRLRQKDEKGSRRRRDRDEDAAAGRAARFTVSATGASGTTVPEPGLFRFQLNEPSASAQPLKPIRWQRDSATQPVVLKGYFEDYFRTRYVVRIPRLGYAAARILIDSAAFRSAYSGQYNKADTLALTILNSETAGLIRGSVKEIRPPLIVELLDESGASVLDTVRNRAGFEFRNLAPGNYRIRLIEDANNNGRWDQGSYRDRRAPERVVPYLEAIKVKANWEVELE